MRDMHKLQIPTKSIYANLWNGSTHIALKPTMVASRTCPPNRHDYNYRICKPGLPKLPMGGLPVGKAENERLRCTRAAYAATHPLPRGAVMASSRHAFYSHRRHYASETGSSQTAFIATIPKWIFLVRDSVTRAIRLHLRLLPDPEHRDLWPTYGKIRAIQ